MKKKIVLTGLCGAILSVGFCSQVPTQAEDTVPIVVKENESIQKNGFVKENGNTYYYQDGEKVYGFQMINGNWYFFNYTTGAREFTGVVQNPKDSKWYFVRNGVGEKFTGWSKSIADGNWYFTRNGVLDWSFTGVAKSVENGKWYHGKNGKLDWNFTGFSTSVENGKWYFSRKGVLDWNFTGVAKSIANGEWYFARKGSLDWSFTGVAKSVENGKWYFVKNGALDWGYTGGAKSVENGKWYAVQKGALNWNYNGKMKGTDGVTRRYKKGSAYRSTLIIGDSRAVNMNQARGGSSGTVEYTRAGNVNQVNQEINDVRIVGRVSDYFCEGLNGNYNGSQYSLTVRRALENIEDNQNVVIMMGTNEPVNANHWVDTVNRFYSEVTSKHKNVKVYFVSVNPSSLIDRERTTNAILKSKLNKNIVYLDSYHELKTSWATKGDGVHYTNPVSLQIYNYVLSKVAK